MNGGPPRAAKILVAGVGNVLLGDEGAGIHAVRELARQAPPGVDIVDAGTALGEIVGRLGGYRKLILVDAVEAGGAPGQIVRLEIRDENDLAAAPLPLSLHELGVAEALRQARLLGLLPPQVVLLGVQPARIAPGLKLSAAVARALPALVEAIRAEAAQPLI